jgi:large subunit ribosomal protein L29
MKAEEFRGLADNELTTRINELEEERFRLRFRAGTEALEEPLRLRSIRRDIARLHTIARERALGIVRTSAPATAKKGAAKKGTATKAAAKKATKARGR